VHALAWNGAGDRLAVGGDGDTVRIWDVTKGVEAKILKESFPSCSSLSFGKGKLAAATGQGTVYVWNSATWKLEASLRHADMQDAKAVAWGSSTDPQVIVGDSEGNLRFLSVSGGNQTGAIELAKSAGGIQALVATGKSRPIWVSGHLDGTVLIWSAAGKNVLNCLASSGASVLDAMVQPNAGASKSAQLTPQGREVCYDLAVSPDERLLAVAAQDVDLWELDSKNYLVRRRFVNGAKNDTGYRAAEFSSDSKLLAVGAGDGTLAIIDIAAWTAVYQEKFPGPINRVAWRTGATRQLAIACEDGTAVVLTLGKDATSATVQSLLDPKQILTEAQQNATDEDWGTLAQRISYLSIYRLPSTDKNTLDSLRLKARKGAQALATSLNPKTVPQEELAEAADTLQQAIDLDPSGEGGKAAREALRQLPPLTVAMLKASADNGAGANQAGGKSAAGNPRGGPAGRRAGGAAMPGMPAGPTKPVRKK
jgi:WD40 repeat protein